MRTMVLVAFFCVAAVTLRAESAAGVRWTAPAGWTNEGTRPMRAATYRIAAAPGDRANAECGVYFFGAGQGGTIDANLERWKSQFKGADGKVAPAQIAKRTINGLAIVTIDTAGEYSGMGGPMAASSPAVPDYRLLGAIVTGPGGNLFVKLTGPAKTVAANQQKFEQILTSFQLEK
jgi:hypothetical protein